MSTVYDRPDYCDPQNGKHVFFNSKGCQCGAKGGCIQDYFFDAPLLIADQPETPNALASSQSSEPLAVEQRQERVVDILKSLKKALLVGRNEAARSDQEIPGAGKE
jgi:hypothetical protein